MKFSKPKGMLVVSVFILLSLKSNIFHAQIKDGQIVNAYKTWSIKFSKNVLWNEISQNSIIVVNENGENARASVNIGQDKTTVLVKPPTGGYLNGKKYKLLIKGEIASEENGMKIKSPIGMTFYIDDLTVTNTAEQNEDEVKSGNLQSAGAQVMVKYKDYIYYRDIDNYAELYRMREDGSGKEPVSGATVVGNMSLDGHNLYYKTLMSSAIVRVDLDTNRTQYVNLKSMKEDDGSTHFGVEEIPSAIIAKDNWIFFTENDETFGFYKMKNDSAGKVKLADNVDSFFIDGNWIYYKDKDNHLNKMQLDGSNNSQVISEEVSKFYVLKNWIFYTDINNSCIKRANTDGTSIATIISNSENIFFYVGEFNIAGDSMYYINSEGNKQRISRVKLNSENGTYVPEVVDEGTSDYLMLLGSKLWYKKYERYFTKIDTGGKNLMTLDKQYDDLIGIDNDWIYYIDHGQEESRDGCIFKIKADGSEKTLVLDKPILGADMDDDYIYYQLDMKLYRCNKDGSNDTIIDEEYGFKTNYDLKVDGDLVYYVECHNESGDYKSNLFRIRKDGTEKQLVTSECSSLLAANNGWVYYVSQGSDSSKTMYQVKSDGTGTEKIGDIKGKALNKGENLIVNGDYLYYINPSNYLYKKKVGSNIKPVLVYGDKDNKAMSIAGIENGYIYFFNNETNPETQKDTYNLAKMSILDDKYSNITQSNGIGLDIKNSFVYYLEDETRWVQLTK